MSYRVVVLNAVAIAALAGHPAPSRIPEPTRESVVQAYGKLPLGFEPNQGQAPAEVKFLSRGSSNAVLLTAREAVLVLRPAAKRTPAVLRMQLVGANSEPAAEGRDPLPGRSNYFIGSDPTGWRTNIPNYGRVEYRQVYPGVDLIYYGNQRQLEFDLVVGPRSDPGAIRLRFAGARRMRLVASGDLVLSMGKGGGQVRFQRPVVYQEADGVRKAIRGRYVRRGKRDVAFAIGNYDATRPLVIDPVIYSTYLGGGVNETGFGIAVDSSGNAYVTGYTGGSFPITPGAYQTTFGGATDAFVTKLNAAGSALVYSTYLGGGGQVFGDLGFGIAVDSSGNAYVTGETGGGFPTTPGAYQTTYGGGPFEAFVTKLNAAGSALVYSTYLGGSGLAYGGGIAVDSSGNAFVTGRATGSFPTTPGAYQTTYGGGIADAFVAKLNAAGSGLVYSTYLGGTGDDFFGGIAVDSSGNAYVAGSTSGSFPTTPGASQTTFGGGFVDAFVTKLNAAGSGLVYSTYLEAAASTVAMASRWTPSATPMSRGSPRAVSPPLPALIRLLSEVAPPTPSWRS